MVDLLQEIQDFRRQAQRADFAARSRQSHLIQALMCAGWTLSEVASVLNLTRSRVSQVWLPVRRAIERDGRWPPESWRVRRD